MSGFITGFIAGVIVGSVFGLSVFLAMIKMGIILIESLI